MNIHSRGRWSETPWRLGDTTVMIYNTYVRNKSAQLTLTFHISQGSRIKLPVITFLHRAAHYNPIIPNPAASERWKLGTEVTHHIERATRHAHYGDVTMGAMASQITCVSIVYLGVCSGTDQRKHQSSASLAFVRGIHRRPVNSPQKASNAENVSIWWRYHENTTKAARSKQNMNRYRAYYENVNDKPLIRCCSTIHFCRNCKYT